MRQAVICEALHRVVLRNLWAAYYGRDQVSIWRHRGLTPEQRKHVAAESHSYVGRKYGYVKIAAHALDWFLFGAYFFRRIAGMKRYPMCVWKEAHAYAVEGVLFLCKPPGMVNPDDLWDEVKDNADWECVFPLGPLKESGEV